MPDDLIKLQRSPSEVARWQRAQQQLLADRHGPALATYRDLVQRFPAVTQLWFEFGIAAAGDLDFSLADEAFQRARQLSPNDASLLLLLGQQYHRLRRLDQARTLFEQSVAKDPGSVNSRLSLAEWYERERRLDDAWACLEECTTKHPRNVQAQSLRALLLHRKGKNSEAETLLRDLVGRNGQDARLNYSIRQLLGTVLDELGNYREAMHWL